MWKLRPTQEKHSDNWTMFQPPDSEFIAPLAPSFYSMVWELALQLLWRLYLPRKQETSHIRCDHSLEWWQRKQYVNLQSNSVVMCNFERKSWVTDLSITQCPAGAGESSLAAKPTRTCPPPEERISSKQPSFWECFPFRQHPRHSTELKNESQQMEGDRVGGGGG